MDAWTQGQKILVDTRWLAAHLDDSHVRIVALAWGTFLRSKSRVRPATHPPACFGYAV